MSEQEDAMSSIPDSSPQNSTREDMGDDQGFEWLLYLASAS
jgi:hypothetical protein